MGINKVILVGNVGKDPDYRVIQENTAVATFSLATSETYKDKNGERQTVTEWHNIVAWRGLAEVAQKYVHKGTQVYIEGKLRSRSWDDQNGVKRYTTEIVADVMQLLGSPQQGSSYAPPIGGEHAPSAQSAPRAQYENTQSQSPAPSPVQEVDDLPF